MLLLIKADQLGLFDKLVPIAASVSKTGIVTPAHTGIRHVRHPSLVTAKHHAKVEAAADDLFAPRTEPKAAPKPETGDLFSAPAATVKPAQDAGFFERQRAEIAARKARAAELASENKPVRMKHKDGRLGMAGADLSRPGKSQFTRFDDAGPIGHTEHDDLGDAILSGLRQGFEPIIAEGLKVEVIGPFDPAAVPAFGVPAGITKARRRGINAEAAAIVESQTTFSPDDIAVLRQYSGNGGCGDSLNEYYTDPAVCSAMWRVLRTLGLPADATVLEPSCATGAFIATAPAGARVVGVELDGVSASIGAVLHPDHEIQNKSLEAFAVQDTRQFDAVIGNPPYGLRGALLKDDKPDLSTAQAYFVDTSIDKTKPGGVTALVIPTGILDSPAQRAFRQRILAKAEFLGALRMPRTAFEASHTEVTTDVVFFRKRPQDVANALGVVDPATMKAVGAWDDEFIGGGYFAGSGAPNVLGNMVGDWRAEAAAKRGEDGGGITVEGSMVGVPEAIADFKPAGPEATPLNIGDVLGAARDDAERERIRSAASRTPYDTAKRGDVKTIDGIEYVLEGDPLRWHRLSEFLQNEAVTEAQDLAADIGRAIEDDGYAAAAGLADRVRAYVKSHGVPSKNPNLMIAAGQDRTLYHLIGAVKPDGSLSDVVEGRRAAKIVSSFDAAATALALEHDGFTPGQLAARWAGGDAEAALDHLYASPEFALEPDGSGRWSTMDQYLSGDLWPKLDAAKASAVAEGTAPADKAKFERQAEALEAAIDPKSLEDVEILMNSAFLPTDVLAAYFNDQSTASENRYVRNSPPMSITFDRGVYFIEGGLYSSRLLDKYLNRTGVRKDDLPEINRMNEEFKTWLLTSRFRDQIEDLYNRTFRGFRQRGYSDAKIDIPGLNDVGLKDYQYSGLRWALQAGKGIIAADVGLGKTARGLMLARMAKVSGQARKPMIVVPKSVLANWLAEAEKWFPGSNVMVIGETYSRDKAGNLKGVPDDAQTRNRKFHDVTQNDYDFILISQPAWNELELNPDIETSYAAGDFWNQRRASLEGADSKKVKKAEEAHAQSLAKRAIARRSDAIFFDQLGVDMIIGDEMHAYKNLYSAHNRFGDSPKFLGGQGLSKRALDMFYKAKWVRDQNGGNNVYGLTATPTKNSPLEIYSMLSHIAPEAFENIGIRNSEEFLDRFCTFENRNILNTQQKIEEKLCVTGFKNLDELRGIMKRYIDRTTAEQVGLQLPARDDRQHLLDMTPEQKDVYVDLRIAAAESAGADATGEDHIFSIMSRMGKAALDLELLGPEYKGAVSPLLDSLTANAAEKAEAGGQVIFCDSIDLHDKIAEMLVAKGIPRERIGILNGQVAASSAQRQTISDAFNSRKKWVVIGNQIMNEGVNLQMGTTDIHHGDLPWDPATMQQRNGRGLRQGNTSESVRIHCYLPKGSFYGYRYQSMLAKKDWQDLLWNGGDRVENLALEGAMSRDDMMVMLSEDPDSAREQLSANKVRAQEQFDTAKHVAAATDFGRFREMSASFAGLKNKASPAGDRLRVKIARLRIGLEANDYFKAKDALDHTKPVAIQPATGVAFQEGVAMEIEPGQGKVQPGRFVVTHVVKGAEGFDIVARPYGDSESYGSIRYPVNDLGKGVKTFTHDAAEEARVAGAALIEAAKTGKKSFSSYSELRNVPGPALTEANDAIQAILKPAFKAYKFSTRGAVAMITADGSPVAVESYSAHAAIDTHDLMLPTPENREKAMDAYIADETAKVFRREVDTRRGRSGSSSFGPMKVKYPGAGTGFQNHQNQWKSIGDEIFGEGFSAAAHAKFVSRQLAAARHAPNFADAAMALAPTATGEYGTIGDWPRRALAILWVQAKRAGDLERPLKDLLPSTRSTYSGQARPTLPDELFQEGDYGNKRQVSTMPTARALIALAKDRGFRDLAAAMVVASTPDPFQAAKALVRLGVTDKHVAAGLSHLIDKHPEIGERYGHEFELRGAESGQRLKDLAARFHDTGDQDVAA